MDSARLEVDLRYHEKADGLVAHLARLGAEREECRLLLKVLTACAHAEATHAEATHAITWPGGTGGPPPLSKRTRRSTPDATVREVSGR